MFIEHINFVYLINIKHLLRNKYMKLLSRKKFLITGISNNRSIAFGIAKVMKAHGATLAFTYHNSLIKKK